MTVAKYFVSRTFYKLLDIVSNKYSNKSPFRYWLGCNCLIICTVSGKCLPMKLITADVGRR